jgi:hypothetical protein
MLFSTLITPIEVNSTLVQHFQVFHRTHVLWLELSDLISQRSCDLKMAERGRRGSVYDMGT